MRSCESSRAIDAMFETAPIEWWRFVSCGYCNSPMQEPCQSTFGPARKPHIRRVRGGLMVHGVLWLIYNGFESDVIGKGASRALS